MTLTELWSSASPIAAVGFRHKNAGLRLLPHQDRQRPDVIEMRVREEDGIDRAPRQRREIGQCRFALLLRMHATIQHDPLLTRAEIVTIGADLGPTRQVDELQNRAPTCQSRAREQSAFF